MRRVRAGLAVMAAAGLTTAAALAMGAGPVAAGDMPMGTSGAGTISDCTWGISLSLSTDKGAFDRGCLAAPPGETFTIHLVNNDSVPHNVAILRAHDAAETLFRGDLVAASRSVTYSVGPLAVGEYHFHCEVHPTTMMGRFVVGGPSAAASSNMMSMSPPPGPMSSGASARPDGGMSQPVSPARSSRSVPTSALLLGVLLCAGGTVVLTWPRRRSRGAGAGSAPAATASPGPDMGRRELVRVGAAGVTGAALVRLLTAQSPAGAAGRLGGIHVSVLTHIVGSASATGFPHHWTLTVYGPEESLSGMGWGGATDLKTQQDVFNSKMFPCIYSLTGAVEGDNVKVHGLMLFSGAPDQGLPLTFEANLKTGTLHVNAYDTFDFEGTGIVARI